MKIIFAVEDNLGRKKCYVTDDCVVRSPAEVIEMTKRGILQDVFIVRRDSTQYLKSKKNATQNIDQVTLSLASLFNQPSVASARTALLLDAFYGRMRASTDPGGYLETEDKKFLLARQTVADRLVTSRSYIEGAAVRFTIDKYLLAAILVDEILRFAPFESVTDFIQAVSNKAKASVGVGQVQLQVARELIQKGYYTPNATDSKLDSKNVSSTSFRYIANYVLQDQHCVYFAAARIRQTADFWEKAGFPIGNEILATLYSIGLGNPKPDPQTSSRGAQIASEFYEFAKTIL